MKDEYTRLQAQTSELCQRLSKSSAELRQSRAQLHGAMTSRVQEARRELRVAHRLLQAIGAGQTPADSGAQAEFQHRQQLAMIANHTSDALMLLSVEPGGVYRCLYLNPAGERAKGIRASRIAGRAIEEFFDPAALSFWKPKYDEVARSRNPLQLETAGPGPAVTEYVETRLEPVVDTGGGCTHILVISRDVTERKRAEEALKNAELAERASRAKDHFLAVLSHELRTPLTPVLAAISLFQVDGRFDPETQETLKMIRRNVELEARLIDDLLDMTRIARGKVELRKQMVPFRDVIRQAMDVCRPDMEARRLEFGVDLGNAAMCMVHADAARLQQVFWNLLKNSVKFTPPGGCVGIRCHQANGQVIAEVTESGAGIERELLPRIFNAFQQAEQSIARQFGGLGLGLSISKALVEMHGGTIEAHSEGKGKGARFRVRLPLAHPTAAAPPVAASAAPGGNGPTKRLRVLLVEDHGDSAIILSRLLKLRGYEVETAGDVASALEFAGRTRFDLLISDLGLPDRSGLDLIRELRAQGQKLPAIALSGYGQQEDVNRSREAGFDAHLVKPVDFEQFYKIIAAVVK